MTEKTLGDNVRTLNRVIRNVKAVVDTETDTFLPGESIIVGYVDDRREHPIIIGLGDSSGHTCIKVTLGIDTNLPVIEGPGAPSLVAPEFNVFFPMSMTCLDLNFLGSEGANTIQAGSTNGVCGVDCTAVEAGIELRVRNGKPPYTWTLPLSGPAGCSYGGVGGPGFGPPTPDSVNDSRLVITAPDNAGGAGVPAFEDRTGTGACDTSAGLGGAGPCLNTPAPCSGGGDCCHSQGNGTFIQRDCNDDPIGGSLQSNAPPGPIEYIESNNAESEACAAENGWFFTPDVGGIVFALRDRLRPTNSIDIRSQAVIDGGCCPCGLAFAGLMVTVSDSASNNITITLELIPEA